MPRRTCAHCGLPVLTPQAGEGPFYCCYGCSLASRIVGGSEQDGSLQAWSVLRLGVGAFLTMNVMMVSLLLYTGEAEAASVPVFRWLLLALSAPAVLLLGYPFALGAAAEVRRGRLSLDSLILAGSCTAFATSAVSTMRGAGHIYFDTATMLLLLVTVGKLVEASAKRRTGELVRGLDSLLPLTATRIDGDGLRDVPLGELRAGDLVRVRPGGRMPVDGVVEDGASSIEEAAFTGESRPRAVTVGGAVLAGTVNGEGALAVRAQRVGGEMLLHNVVRMVEEAGERASPSERLAERAAALFIPVVLALAAGAGLFWLVRVGPAQAGFVALAVIVVACPCAMGIATPLATALAVGRAAREGVLVRGGDVMERIGRLDTLFLDKTGTVTSGRPAIVALQPTDPAVSEEDLLGWLAGLESASEHSLAAALLREAGARGLEAGSVRGLRVLPGRGVSGTVLRLGEERQVLAGSEALFEAPPVLPPAEPDMTSVVVGWGGAPRGRVLLRDAVRPDAAEAVAALAHAGIRTVLLSGDRPEVADATARNVGIPVVEAPCTPEQKLDHLRRAGAEGRVAGMVGDGINDAPALSAAEVGIALGAGTDLARQAGNVVLVSDRLAQVPWLVGLSRRTRRIIVQNLAWAAGYNAVALGAAAAGLLHPLIAALAMVVSSVTVLGNSLRVRAC